MVITFFKELSVATEIRKQMLGDILIVDDDPDICEIMKEYCKEMGCFRNVLIANDGSAASNMLRNQKFVLILLDLKMPKKAGLDLLKELDDKSLNRRKNVLVVSGNIDKTMFDKIVALGVKNFLPKPFDEAIFKEKILKIVTLAK